jgi:hypothetical protein
MGTNPELRMRNLTAIFLLLLVFPAAAQMPPKPVKKRYA